MITSGKKDFRSLEAMFSPMDGERSHVTELCSNRESFQRTERAALMSDATRLEIQTQPLCECDGDRPAGTATDEASGTRLDA